MFIQIHMLQSMPPGNLNRDETGQPKKCLFGGVTRGRISSQCLKRNIRMSPEFKEAFGDTLANRTVFLPRMIADAIKTNDFGVPEEEIPDLMAAIAAKFKKEKTGGDVEEESDTEEDEQDVSTGATESIDGTGVTGQLVFFQQPFAQKIAELMSELRTENKRLYDFFIGRKLKPKVTKEEEKEIKKFVQKISEASKTLTVDIGLFGRMTTSDLVVNVEASCQVAHAISTHETMIESDYFTAMDDLKTQFATTQTAMAGAAFIGSGETEVFFNSGVYYKYLNLDTEGLKKNLPSLSIDDMAKIASTLIRAAAYATPAGKQNSFAAHSVPELILVEVSKTKRPISYANAFLQPVVSGADRNLMTESSKALNAYIESVISAFEPPDMYRFLLTAGAANVPLTTEHEKASTINDLVKKVSGFLTKPDTVESTV